MDYKEVLQKAFSHPGLAGQGPKTPGDQLKAFLWQIAHDLEDGLGGVSFDDSKSVLIIENPDGGDPLEVPLADLAALGFSPLAGQTAEDFVVTHFQSWESDDLGA